MNFRAKIVLFFKKEISFQFWRKIWCEFLRQNWLFCKIWILAFFSFGGKFKILEWKYFDWILNNCARINIFYRFCRVWVLVFWRHFLNVCVQRWYAWSCHPWLWLKYRRRNIRTLSHHQRKSRSPEIIKEKFVKSNCSSKPMQFHEFLPFEKLRQITLTSKY